MEAIGQHHWAKNYDETIVSKEKVGMAKTSSSAEGEAPDRLGRRPPLG